MKKIKNTYLRELSLLKESEDHIEFKEAKRNFNWDGGEHRDPKDRRHCILGYVAALANEKGGKLVFGMKDDRPHEVVGTSFEQGNLGALEDAIYERMQIRVPITEEFEPSKEAPDRKRVIIFNVPSRPIGKMLKYEGVPLMRTGESLREMSDAEMFKILSEQEPDFSAKPCEGLTIEDLDRKAIEVMKQKYAVKNENPGFESVSDKQALSDLDLLVDGKLNYAALILLGKGKAIRKYLPQNNVVIEFRNDPASIQFDDRIEIQQPLFLAVDEIWAYFNQPSLNPQVHINHKAYIYDVKLFRQETVREAVLNAIAHRSMIVQSDVVIKLSPAELTITNAGGFPIGVDKSNVLTVNSTPRSKRLAEVMQKTGLVEKSGQGVDKMFTNCIMEAKPLPDYSATDNFQVALTLRTEIRNGAFMVYIRQEQNRRPEHHKLNVFQLLALYSVCMGDSVPDVAAAVVDGLVDEGLLVRSKTGKLSMGKEYKAIAKEMSEAKNGGVKGDVNDSPNDKVNDSRIDRLNDSVKTTYLVIKANPGIQRKCISDLTRKSVPTIDRHLAKLVKEKLIEHKDSDKTGGYYPL